MSANLPQRRRGLAVATVSAGSYLSCARVLARSFRAHHPDVPFFVALTDEVGERIDPASEPFDLIAPAELGIPSPRDFFFRYDRREAAVAAKAFLLSHLLDRGFERALFLDADMLVVGDLAPLFAALERSPILLTPHLLEPPHGAAPARRELAILAAGAYNGGVVGIGDGVTARRFLTWWRERLLEHCRLDPASGLHHDQGWHALTATHFDGVEICRDLGVNVAYWNLAERPLARRDGIWLAGGARLRLLHFSGFDPEAPATLSRHAQPGDSLPEEAAGLWRSYARELLAAGWRECRAWPYAFGCFDDGSAIPDLARRIYAGLGRARERFGDPFATSAPGCFADWLVGGDGGEPARTPLWSAVLEVRPDVRAAFPDPAGADREGFRRWIASSGAREHGIAARFLPAADAGAQ